MDHSASSDEAPRSPCIGVCALDRPGGRCVGCLRELREVARWVRLSDDEKRAVLAAIADRRAELPPA
ncbi:DUF1289 domain-containing protein [Zavarzinia sp. CC-PAN008]|uniref:DUF1289 domain-containing protein n=1 Tax=Zavarzinia sp. CC-PAN008 TaxID=3243332 RepID=UPI003F74AA18